MPVKLDLYLKWWDFEDAARRLTMNAAALTWDTCLITKDHADFLRQQDSSLTDEEAFRRACEDGDLLQYEFDALSDALTDLMTKHETTSWVATVENFGWRALSGRKAFVARDGRELLRQVLPNTDCTFKVFEEGDHLAIQNWHHDSPTGKEWYRIYPRKDEE